MAQPLLYSGPTMFKVSKEEHNEIVGIPKIVVFSVSWHEMDFIAKGKQDLYFLSASTWGHSRLIDKSGFDRKISLIKFTNGSAKPNGKQPPHIILEFLGYYRAKSDHIVTFGHKKYIVKENDFIIRIGDLKIVRY